MRGCDTGDRFRGCPARHDVRDGSTRSRARVRVDIDGAASAACTGGLQKADDCGRRATVENTGRNDGFPGAKPWRYQAYSGICAGVAHRECHGPLREESGQCVPALSLGWRGLQQGDVDHYRRGVGRTARGRRPASARAAHHPWRSAGFHGLRSDADRSGDSDCHGDQHCRRP